MITNIITAANNDNDVNDINNDKQNDNNNRTINNSNASDYDKNQYDTDNNDDIVGVNAVYIMVCWKQSNILCT